MFSFTIKLALGLRPCLCLPGRAHCCSVTTLSYLLLATASCGLETLSFLTSFLFPHPSHMQTGCHFFNIVQLNMDKCSAVGFCFCNWRFKGHLHILLYDAVAVSQRFLYTANSCSKTWNPGWGCASVRHL